eukprot:CAMPEP_0196804884 /NCGR_PEP_ID=MMETSP1362-20130617/4568_1 /TAXON_ID=163516 /ORGANISM="Leptocylindrus danicus, Strain CCMP1856" /LENGTH=284 /DNA_ID=CAMNT_0042177453 /DNA_START=212 /DNA_END=1066 /DNA_ORIENTATION=+
MMVPQDANEVIPAALTSVGSLLAYSDDPLGDQLKGINGAVLGAIFVTVIAVGAGFVALLPKVGTASFDLSAEEEDAVLRVEGGFDAKGWEKELTEQGTKGYVNRKRKAEEAKESYQSTVESLKEMKDKSLRYSEADLGFIACLLRAAEPQVGNTMVDLGSGAGRSTLGAATIFPGFKKVTGIEFLQPLVKLSNTYKGKVKGKKAPVEFKCADFATEDLSSYDVVLASTRYLNAAELGSALSTLQSGAKVMTIDQRLGSGFKLITTVDDPSGDLVLNTGYVYERL